MGNPSPLFYCVKDLAGIVLELELFTAPGLLTEVE